MTNRISESYPLHVVLIEMFFIWIVVFFIVRFLRGTRGARVIKGAALLLFALGMLIQLFGDQQQFERLNYLSGQFFSIATLALVIVFQPELRRALVRLGEARFFRGGGLEKAKVIEQLIGSVAYLSKNKIGALIAIERQVGLSGIVEAGTRVDAVVTKELLNTIFWPGSALHDMGVVIRGDRIIAAGVQFPLAEGDPISSELGSRHRSAIGLSQEADALVVIVSEETGIISVAERGQLTRQMTPDTLRTLLVRGLAQIDIEPPDRETPTTTTPPTPTK